MGKLERLREKKTARQYHTRTLIALVSYTITVIPPSVSFPISSPSSRPSSIRLISIISSIASRISSRPPSLPHGSRPASSPHHHIDVIRHELGNDTSNTGKNELNKTARLIHLALTPPRRDNQKYGETSPPPQHHMTAREHHHRRHTPHRAATRHESDTTRRNEMRNEPRGKTRHKTKRTRRETTTMRYTMSKTQQDETLTTKCYRHETRRQDKTQSGTHDKTQ